MTTPLITRIFQTPIGQVACTLAANLSKIKTIGTKEYKNGKSICYQTISHSIELIEFKIKQPLYNGGLVTDSNGWIWRIEKVGESDEKLSINCALTDYSDKVDFDTALGEHLDAIQAIDDKWILHIGTEDGEILYSRAESNDWFPERMKDKVNFYQSITEIRHEGLETAIPELRVGEKIHIQYLAAYDSPNQRSVNTWLAVNEFKSKLEYWIGID